MPVANQVAVLGSGFFLLLGLGMGGWKYAQIRSRPEARAHAYVDVGHRSALMYSFACLALERYLEVSQLSPTIELWATSGLVLFFALAQLSYVVHGLLADTDNQLRRPHRLGALTLAPPLVTSFMLALTLVEMGGLAVLLFGVVRALD